eukprot:COSAG06_NODE_64518_length_259_cov_0.650000_1_plen_80_part_01
MAVARFASFADACAAAKASLVAEQKASAVEKVQSELDKAKAKLKGQADALKAAEAAEKKNTRQLNDLGAQIEQLQSDLKA